MTAPAETRRNRGRMSEPEFIEAMTRAGFGLMLEIRPQRAMHRFRHPSTGPLLYAMPQHGESFRDALKRLLTELAAARAETG